jgi:hypothetical protein
MSTELAATIFSINVINVLKSFEEPDFGTIWYLEMVNGWLSIVNDSKPFTNLEDERLLVLEKIGNMFEDWDKAQTKYKLTDESMEDMMFNTIGFSSFIKYCLLLSIEEGKQFEIHPKYMNQNIVENYFGLQQCSKGLKSSLNINEYRKNSTSLLVEGPQFKYCKSSLLLIQIPLKKIKSIKAEPTVVVVNPISKDEYFEKLKNECYFQTEEVSNKVYYISGYILMKFLKNYKDKNPPFELMTTKLTKKSQSKLCSSSELFVGFVNHVVGIAHLRFLRHNFIIKHKELAFKFMLEFLKDIYSEQWNTLTQSLWSEV